MSRKEPVEGSRHLFSVEGNRPGEGVEPRMMRRRDRMMRTNTFETQEVKKTGRKVADES